MINAAAKMTTIPAIIACLCIVGGISMIEQTDALADQSQIVAANTKTPPQGETGQNNPWQPLAPPPDEYDWIQLNSGEWLKGELKVLYDDKLEFDSDELDLLVLDWEDVKQVRGHRRVSVRLVGPITVDGLLEVDGDEVFITAEGSRQVFRRSELLAIAPGESKEINYWSGKLSLGLNLQSGNSDQSQFTTMANVMRRTSASRFVTDYFGNYTRVEGEETANNNRLNSYYDIFRTRKYFFRPLFGEYYRDPIKNLEHRITVGTGIGYHIIDTAKTEWDVFGGPAYQRTRFKSVEAGRDRNESTLALVAGTEFNTELTKRIDFDFQYNFQIVNETSGTYNHHLVATFETELTSWLDFDISCIWDRIQDPQPNEDGTIPDKDDYYLIFALGIDF